MAATRKYFEELIKLLNGICKIKDSDYHELDNLKRDLNIAIKKINQYHLFDIKFSNAFFNLLDSLTTNFKEEQKLIAKELYLALGEIVYTFETVSPIIDYPRALELCRTELLFESASDWDIVNSNNNSFSIESLFFNQIGKWLSLKTKDEFNIYKENLRKLQPVPIGKIKEKKYPKRSMKKSKISLKIE